MLVLYCTVVSTLDGARHIQPLHIVVPYRTLLISATAPIIIAISFALLAYMTRDLASEASARAPFVHPCIALTIQFSPCVFKGDARMVHLERNTGTFRPCSALVYIGRYISYYTISYAIVLWTYCDARHLALATRS